MVYQVVYHGGTANNYEDSPVFRSLKAALASVPEMMEFRINNSPIEDATIIDAETGEILLTVNLHP